MQIGECFRNAAKTTSVGLLRQVFRDASAVEFVSQSILNITSAEVQWNSICHRPLPEFTRIAV